MPARRSQASFGAPAWIAWIGLALAVLSGAAWFVLVAQSMSDQPLADVFSEDMLWTVLSETDFGHDWLARLALAVPPRRPVRSVPVGEAGAVGLDQARRSCLRPPASSARWPGPATQSAAQGIEGVVHPAADVLHLVAAAAWVGTLLPLALLLRATAGDAAVGRHGAYGDDALFDARHRQRRHAPCHRCINTWYLAGSIAALTETDYGRLLLIKIALFLGMVAIAAVNRLQLTPRLVAGASARAAGDALRRLRRNVAIEIAAGAIVIAIVAVLGVTPPGLDEQAMPHAHHHSH